MLQQTQVATVIPYYLRFLERFPNMASLAKAKESEVLQYWSGLGYYRRARLLHRGVQKVWQENAGILPQEIESLKGLPGIGPYTAGAIASIAFGQAAPLVDGNVVRVLSRYFGLKGHAKSPELLRTLWEIAAILVSPSRPGDFNQGLMELGATVCRTRLPACERCPLAKGCVALNSQDPEAFPETPPLPKTLKLTRLAAVAQRGETILLVQAQHQRWFQGLWGLPGEFLDREADDEGLLSHLSQAYPGLKFSRMVALPATRHAITHHRITTQAWSLQVSGKLTPNPSFKKMRFFPKGALPSLALPNFDRKVLQAGGFCP